jgi:conjugative transfer region protein TrbK
VEGKVLARIAAIIFVAVAITATIIEMTREEAVGPAPAAAVLQPTVDPLREDLRRCQQMGETAASDAQCLRVWSENRDRFLDRRSAPDAAAPSERR